MIEITFAFDKECLIDLNYDEDPEQLAVIILSYYNTPYYELLLETLYETDKDFFNQVKAYMEDVEDKIVQKVYKIDSLDLGTQL